MIYTDAEKESRLAGGSSSHYELTEAILTVWSRERYFDWKEDVLKVASIVSLLLFNIETNRNYTRVASPPHLG
jgi:hypothetical protein